MPQKVLAVDLDDSKALSQAKPKNQALSWWKRVWIKRRRSLVGGLGVLLIAAAGGLYWYIQSQPSSPIAKYIPVIPTPTPEVPSIPNPLNGILYTKAEAEQFKDRRPMAVMIENHTAARPQAGLAEAEMIYEAMAEGGITRFMALYLHNSPAKIMPVRSARLHFINWAAEYDAIYAHWGGSAEALDFLHSHSRPKDLDQFRYAGAFYRDYSTGRSLEHTGATSMEGLRKTAQKQGWESSATFDAWSFKDDAAADARPVSQAIDLGFLGTFGYAAHFDYQPESNTYLRSTGGQPHVDAAGQQLNPKTIILLMQPVTNYVDTNGHAAVRVDNIGSGEAVVIEDGMSTEGTWRKDSRDSRTLITDSQGKKIALNRGQIWVISVPSGSAVSY